MARRYVLAVAALVAVALAVLLGSGAIRGGAATPARKGLTIGAAVKVLPGAQALALQFERVVGAVQPSVVQIQTPQGLGSGIVADAAGHIVTNAHVVGTAKTFTVTLYTGRRVRGTLTGSFPPEDIAVIDIDAPSLRPASWARSSVVRVGSIVMAVGNPLGLRASVTQGIVSAVGRLGEEGGGVVLPDTIQTSAAINPGNSGGALVDLRGQVVGIPTLAAINPEAGTPAAGIGFAISSDRALFIARQLIASGHVSSTGRAYLGVRVAQSAGAPGVVVAFVDRGTPAARSGIRAGEAIVSVDGRRTPTPQALAAVLATKRPGQTVRLKLASPTAPARTVRVRLGQLPGS